MSDYVFGYSEMLGVMSDLRDPEKHFGVPDILLNKVAWCYFFGPVSDEEYRNWSEDHDDDPTSAFIDALRQIRSGESAPKMERLLDETLGKDWPSLFAYIQDGEMFYREISFGKGEPEMSSSKVTLIMNYGLEESIVHDLTDKQASTLLNTLNRVYNQGVTAGRRNSVRSSRM